MTTPMRHERDLPPILGDLAMAPYPDYVDDVLGRTGRMRQRPAWTFPGRWLPMDITTRTAAAPRLPWRQLGILALIALLLATALAVYVGTQRHVPAPFGPARNGLIPYISSGDIYVGDPVTGRTTLLLGGPDDDASPGYSPDGTRIAFIRSAPAGGHDQQPVDLYVMHDDGSNVTKITSAPVPKLVWANWTPDGRHWPSSIRWTACNQTDLHRLPTAGCRPQRTRRRRQRGPDRRSGHRTVGSCSSAPSSEGKYGLFVMNADGTNVRTLVTPTNTVDVGQDLNAVTYSADGARIFYQRWIPGLDPAVGDERRRQRMQHEFVPKPGAAWDGIPRPRPTVDGWPSGMSRRTGAAPRNRSPSSAPTGPAPSSRPVLPLMGTAHWTWAPDSTKILMMSETSGRRRRSCSTRRAVHGPPSRGSPTRISTGNDTRSERPAPDRAARHQKKEPRVVGPGVQGVCGLVAGRGFEPLTFGL